MTSNRDRLLPEKLSTRGYLCETLRRLLIPRPMVKAGLFFLVEDAAAVVSVLARTGVCQIERVPTEFKECLAPCFPDEFRNAYRRLRELYEPLAQRWQVRGRTNLSVAEQSVPSVELLNRLADSLEAVAIQANEVDRRRKQLDQRQAELEHFDEYVRTLAELDIDVEALADLRFLHLRVGTVPIENLDRLRESAALSEDLVLSLGLRRDRAHVLVVGVGGVTPDLEGLLSKAQFEPLDVSDSIFAKGSGDVRIQLQSEEAAVQAASGELRTQDAQLRQVNDILLLDVAQVLARAAVFAECDGALEGRELVAFLSGWVAADRLPALQGSLERDIPNPVALAYESATDVSVDGMPPSEMAVPAIFRPGAALVSLYGVPGYDEINPTLFLAATTPLMFGMMFGDVGYGLLLGIAALICRRRLGPWVTVALSCSVATCVFGFLYGSVFGIEHWLPAVWLRPMDEPFRLLSIALWSGVAFMLVTFLLKAMNLLRQRRPLAALLGFQAGAGALFYLGAVFAAQALYSQVPVPQWAAGLIVVGAVLTAIHLTRELYEHGQTAFADLASEMFHGLLSLVTNTLSFLRLAAFALSHAALSMALFLVIETIPPTGAGWVLRVLLLVAGAAVTLVLHALVVAVQTVRLQFYEGLTRYYRGDGHVFRPLRFPHATPI